jgi:hypothetical protein
MGEESAVPSAQPPSPSSIRQIAILNDVIRGTPGAKIPVCLEAFAGRMVSVSKMIVEPDF